MIDIFLEHIGTLLAGLVSAILGWVAKSKVSKRAEEADLTAKIQEVYSEFVQHTKTQIHDLQLEIERLKKLQHDTDVNWRQKLNDVDRKWQSKYNALKKSFDNYKKTHP